MTPTLRRAGAVTAAAGLLLSLAGCAGMGGSAEAAAPSANADCASVDKVTVVLQWVTQAQFAGYYAAKDKGFYADQCLDVTIQEGGTNVVPQQVLASGNAEFAVSHVIKSMASREQGADVINISQTFERGAYLQVSWADSGISSLTDLKGTKMGSWGGGNELTLYAALKAEGIDPTTDITVLQQPFDMSMLLNREADSVQAKTYNEYAQLLETVNPATGKLYQPSDFSVLDFQKLGYGTLEDGVYARGDWLAEGDNADIATRFLAGTNEGWAFCRDDADACVDMVVAQGSALGRTHQAWMMNEINKLMWPSTAGIATLSEEDWTRTVQVGIEGGVLTKDPGTDAYRTDLNAAALKLLEAKGVDVTGADWTPATVTLTEGGK